MDSMHIVKNKTGNLKVICNQSLFNFLTFFFNFKPELFKKKKLSNEEIKEKSAKNLTKNVSHFIGHLGENDIFFEKTIILKEDNEIQLENRLQEIMKFEEMGLFK